MHASEFVRDEPLQHDVVKNTRARLRINERPSSSEIDVWTEYMSSKGL